MSICSPLKKQNRSGDFETPQTRYVVWQFHHRYAVLIHTLKSREFSRELSHSFICGTCLSPESFDLLNLWISLKFFKIHTDSPLYTVDTRIEWRNHRLSRNCLIGCIKWVLPFSPWKPSQLFTRGETKCRGSKAILKFCDGPRPLSEKSILSWAATWRKV